MSMRGSPFAIVSFVKPYCFARNLQNRREDKDCCVTKMGRKERRVDKGPACLVDNSAKISNIADLKFAMNWAQTHLRCRVIWTSI